MMLTTRSNVPTLALVFVCVAAAGCALQEKKVEKNLEHPAPINCATADGDLRVLQSEKAHVAGRIAEGVTAIYPAGLVVGLLTGTEGTKIKVATGKYNEAIDARIAEIKQTCATD